MIHDQGMRVREILKDAFGRFQKYYPSNKFAHQSESWHKSNLDQIITDLSRDFKTKFVSLEDFEKALDRGITGEWDEKLVPSISMLTFPIIKKWILRHKSEEVKVNTGPKYEETSSGGCDPALSAVYAWFLRSQFVPLRPGKFEPWAVDKVLGFVKANYPERYAKQIKLLEGK